MAEIDMAIRRSRRSGAKHVDLSNRGLRSWPEELSNLRTLESLDISGNALEEIPNSIAQLQQLAELNLSNNKFASGPALAAMNLPQLRSLILDGNPLVAALAPGVARQLANPPVRPSETSAEVIQSLLTGQASFSGAASSGYAPRPPPGPPPPDFVQHAAVPAAPPISEEDAFARALAGEGDGPAWRKELERLRNRVAELEASPVQASETRNDASAKPSWLNDMSQTSSKLGASLASRRGEEVDEAADLRAQLKEEQRRSKRLESDLQKLNDRLKEQTAAPSGASSTPSFERAEIEMGEQIGQGGFCIVRKATWCSTTVAMKDLFDPSMSEENFAEFDNEVRVLEQLRHPNILALLAVHRKPPTLSIITELVEGGSLFQLLHQALKFVWAAGPAANVSNNELLKIAEGASVGISYLHARNVVHRDIKTHNVLLTPHLDVKLCDFGLARMKSQLMTGTMQFAGTPNYMAPEIFQQRKYTEKIDVFAYGVMLWEMMERDIPFANLDPADIKEKVVVGNMPPMPGAAPPAVRELILACWTLDPVARPSMAEVHQFALAATSAPRAGAGAARPRRPQTATGTGPRDNLSSFAGRSMG